MSANRSRLFEPYAEPIAHAVLAACAALLFARVTGFPFLAFDDAEFILRNPQVTAPFTSLADALLTPRVGYVIPVTVAFEALLFRASDGAAWSFHAAALVLHVIFAAQTLTLARRLGASLPAAWAAALLFALHPLVVQPLAWAICLKDLLMANLLLGATQGFLWCADPNPRDRSVRAHAALTWLLAVLALLAKPSASTLGFAWLGYSLARARWGSPVSNGAVRLAAGVAGAGIVVALASRFAHDSSFGDDALSSWSPLTPFAVLGRQLLHVLWPADLLIVYASPAEQPQPGFALLGLFALPLFAWLCLRVRRTAESLLPLLLGILIYLPTSNLLPFGRVISDSYMYVPLAMLAVFIAVVSRRVLAERSSRTRGVCALVAGALALGLAHASSAQLERYRGGKALWQPVVRAFPKLAIAQRLLGDELLFRGDPVGGAQAYRRAYADDYDPRYLLQYGTLLGMAGRVEDAECVLIEATAYGANRGYAIFNYAALLAVHREYSSKHPAIARQLLDELDQLRRQRQVDWPAELDAGLAQQLAALRQTPATAQVWPHRNCAALKPD